MGGAPWATLVENAPAGDYTLGTLAPGSYQWRASGVNTAGTGTASEVVSATVTVSAPTAAPGDPSLTMIMGGVRTEWTAGLGETQPVSGYRIYNLYEPGSPVLVATVDAATFSTDLTSFPPARSCSWPSLPTTTAATAR